MHTRRIAAFLLGAWLLGTVLVAVVTRESYSAMDRVFADPIPAAAGLTNAGAGRLFLRYYAAALNQIIVNYWEWAEVVLGLALAGILFSARYVSRLIPAACGAMVLLVAFLHFVITPELDFIQLRLAADSARQHDAGMLGGVYASVEAVKFVIGAGIAVYLFTFKNGSRNRVRRNLDGIDNADYSHINR